MKLYHFTSIYHIESCLSEGLRLGVIFKESNGRLTPIFNMQWLTVNPNRHQQYWNTMNLISYDRAENCIEVNVPQKHEKNLIKFSEMVSKNSFYKELAGVGGHEDWYLYKGIIPAAFLRRITNANL